ncbi:MULTISPECIES: hypothetical protein [Halobacteriovorax]|uniref:Uncharacterized protein n=1 Tax=Halobacteriovorax vibrionivorans TaxID=2152716 RepID=A0ABY0IF12_9BACT|nr:MULTISPECIES: hypothetical protein [Halobacteriovorax]AYF43923.1 hypothetical protein BALOs_0913 [Halobacteriovorax sp. BALOs_7]RZF21546.1 hypothetical protein DAY19_07610 [Halobacteriovorax vibrionivorans]TGD49161.1 hypothetical protein EP118_01440 [Halobacteriovorax sp. Y22]
MSQLSPQMKEELLAEIKSLESQLTGNMMDDMDIRGRIHNIKMKLEGVKPVDSFVDCIGCGS